MAVSPAVTPFLLPMADVANNMPLSGVLVIFDSVVHSIEKEAMS